jgi:hypothetical protein
MRQHIWYIFLFLFSLFPIKNNAQNNTIKPSNSSKQIIEKYFWKGPCDKNGFEQLTFEVYNDSTFILRPLECKDMYKSKRILFKTKKEWKASRHLAANGTWKIYEGKRKYFQNSSEMPIKQGDSSITFKDSTILKSIK